MDAQHERSPPSSSALEKRDKQAAIGQCACAAPFRPKAVDDDHSQSFIAAALCRTVPRLNTPRSLSPFTQRRKRHRQHVRHVIEIGPEVPLLNHVSQVLVRHCNYPDIGLKCMATVQNVRSASPEGPIAYPLPPV